MVKVTGQDIPSDDRTDYKRSCQISTTSKGVDYIRKRFPWRMKQMQEGGYGVSASQKKQRDRFKYVKDKYATLSAADKKRWADANPEWHSYLFGYNYFMLEGFLGGGPTEYPQMIKSIQVHKSSVPTTGGYTFNLDPVVVGAKSVVLMQGSARKVPKIIRGSGNVAAGGSTLNLGDTIDPIKCSILLSGGASKEVAEGVAVLVAPYVTTLWTTRVGIAWSLTPDAAADVGWEISEHFEGAVQPVLVSISNTQVAVDWAEVPDAAAYVSITVVEYI